MPVWRDDLCRKILGNVIGFDLNPLAVMAARTNYLVAIRDLIGHVDKVEIPVCLCDSILTPSEYGGLFAGTDLRKAKELKTAAADFLIPAEIAGNRTTLRNMRTNWNSAFATDIRRGVLRPLPRRGASSYRRIDPYRPLSGIGQA